MVSGSLFSKSSLSIQDEYDVEEQKRANEKELLIIKKCA